jgi:Domain of unknown function (DUF1841)
MFNPTQQEVRDFFCHTWQKATQKQVLTPIESMAVDCMTFHPEYHDLLNNIEQARSEVYTPERGVTNPFLHLSMHLSIHEQVSINQPKPIREVFEKLAIRSDEHHAYHAIMEVLAEILWQSQQQKTPLNAELYVEKLQQLQ